MLHILMKFCEFIFHKNTKLNVIKAKISQIYTPHTHVCCPNQER